MYRPGASGLLVAILAAGCAAGTPVTVSSPTAHTPAHAPEAVACPVRVVEIVDDRMDPKTLGEVGGRPVRAPADANAWLRDVISGLQQYGVVVQFGEETPAPARVIDARAELKTAWVASVTTAKTASVVLTVQYLRADTLLKAVDYRGSVSSVNWNSSTGEIQNMLDDAFGQVLRQVTTDVRALCAQTGDTGQASGGTGQTR